MEQTHYPSFNSSSEENKGVPTLSDFGGKMIFNSSNNDTEVTDIDADPFLIEPTFDKVQLSTERPSSSHLQSILSGKQSSKAAKKAKKKVKGQTEKVIINNDHLETDGDVSDNLDSSFTESKSNDLRRDYEVIELERKMYGENAKQMSAKDLFASLKKDTNKQEVVELPVVVLDEDDLVDTLESKVYSNLKTTSASDFLRSMKPKEPKESKKSKSKEAKIQKLKNHKISKLKSGTRPSMLVTLRLSPDCLSKIKSSYNPLFTKGNEEYIKNPSAASSDFFKVDVAKKSTKSLFDSMMNSAKTQVKLTPLQKLKFLDPPILTRDQFHVFDRAEHILQERQWNGGLSYLNLRKPTEKMHDFDSKLIGQINSNNEPEIENYIFTEYTTSKIELLQEKIPNYAEVPQLKAVVERFIINQSNNNSLLWTQLFQPEAMEEVLMNPENVSFISNWIQESFVKLRTQSLQKPRNILIKQKKQKRQKISALSSLNGFVIDDSLHDVLDTYDTIHDDIFVPLLILKGEAGSCKSSSIYAAMQELNGYVHEINTGSNRGRKDIYNSLKEFCTTQLVHQQNESKTFQQGLVLLEDVNVLFEQDKNFWSVVSDVLNISRRPIVLTCEDLSNIPKGLLEFCVEENSIVDLDEKVVSRGILQSYLWICSLSQGLDVSTEILEEVIQDNFNGCNYDLRKCLMDLQHLCSIVHGASTSFASICRISKKQNVKPRIEVNDLDSMAHLIELLSAADVTGTNEISQLNHQVQENELNDIYLIDETHQLKQATLPFELNTGNCIANTIAKDYRLNFSIPSNAFTNRQLKEMTIEFFGSRTKPKPKFIQDLLVSRRTTRSRTENDELVSLDSLDSNWISDSVGVPDSSCLHYLNPTPLILEVMPVAREWLAFQVNLDQFEREALKEGAHSMKQFLNYRDFQVKGNLPKSLYCPSAYL